MANLTSKYQYKYELLQFFCYMGSSDNIRVYKTALCSLQNNRLFIKITPPKKNQMNNKARFELQFIFLKLIMQITLPQ